MLLRLSYLWVFAIAVLLFLAALYFQFVLHLEPCPLCILQRIALAALGLAALAAAVHGRWNRFYATHFPLGDALQMVLSGSGECAEAHLFLGLPIPGWTLLWFLIFTAFALTAFFARRR